MSLWDFEDWTCFSEETLKYSIIYHSQIDEGWGFGVKGFMLSAVLVSSVIAKPNIETLIGQDKRNWSNVLAAEVIIGGTCKSVHD